MYRRMVPEIAEAIIRKDEPVTAAEELAERYEMDTVLVYKWFQLTETDLETHRKRAAVTAMIPLWVSVMLLAGLLIAVIAGTLAWNTLWAVAVIAGSLVLAAASAVRLRGLTARVYRRRVTNLTDTSE